MNKINLCFQSRHKKGKISIDFIIVKETRSTILSGCSFCTKLLKDPFNYSCCCAKYCTDAEVIANKDLCPEKFYIGLVD